MKKIKIRKNLREKNENIAKENRELFQQYGIYTINLVGSPGAGKTSFLERIIEEVGSRIKLAVIEGDLYTTRDAERIEKKGIPVVQVNTGGICHLEAGMVKEALEQLDLANIDLLIIENVGNLVCTAEFDLGEEMMITVLSVTEGDDKPIKYPNIFERSAVVIINKLDLIEMTDFSINKMMDNIQLVNSSLEIFKVSCRTGNQIKHFTEFLEKLVKS